MPQVLLRWNDLMGKINTMENIVVVGAGGFGREVKMLIDQINEESPKFNFIGFYDDSVQKGTKIE
jgi:hypothetical protein